MSRKNSVVKQATVATVEKDLSENANATFNVFVNNNLKASSRVAIAMRIYEADSLNVKAELAFAEGETMTVDWNNISDRNKHLPLINGYTLIFDERTKNSKPFEYWKNRKNF